MEVCIYSNSLHSWKSWQYFFQKRCFEGGGAQCCKVGAKRSPPPYTNALVRPWNLLNVPLTELFWFLCYLFLWFNFIYSNFISRYNKHLKPYIWFLIIPLGFLGTIQRGNMIFFNSPPYLTDWSWIHNRLYTGRTRKLWMKKTTFRLMLWC